MPGKNSKPSGMFGVEASASSNKKVPTLREYLKENSAHGLSSSHLVEVVWFPGKYDNYTLQTSEFRASVSSNAALYSALSENLDSFTKGSSGIELVFGSDKRGVYTLAPSQIEGDWFFISDNGIKFEPTDTEDV
jgi:hypothetical protein